MKNLFSKLLILSLVISIKAFGQAPQLLSPNLHIQADYQLFNPELKPFYHGVASGDPLPNQVIIWTRVSPDSSLEEALVSWFVATDTAMENIVVSGDTLTNALRDFTVKVDVGGLSSNTVYYYMFRSQGRNSLVGRTRTAPENADHLRFGVVSCSNYEAGYFNAYGRLGARNDLHAIIHLGDYIYEQEAGVYGDSSLADRRHQNFETVTLDEYRARYALYRLDADLRRAHQQHAFINVWDDHESANDAWSGGAQNHTEGTEGSWQVRKAMARQAFFEWIPMRDVEDSLIYRKLSYGNLMDLIMLDTRIVGRDQQPSSIADTNFLDPNRSILGLEQKQWLKDQLSQSQATWKVIGNQVLFAQFHVGWSGPLSGFTFEQVESLFLDIWDGYPLERLELINYFRDNSLDNTVFLTGDSHASFAFDLADSVVFPAANYAPHPNYISETGEGSVAVEFATPSITSANFDENTDPIQSALLEKIIIDGESILIQPPLPSPNPHMKWVDLDRHGYILLDVKRDSIQANWFYVDKLNEPSDQEEFGAGYVVLQGENRLKLAEQESEKKVEQDIPAPLLPINNTVSSSSPLSQNLALFSLYPNPAGSQITLMFGLNHSSKVQVAIWDVAGRQMWQSPAALQATGIYQSQLNVGELPPGMYVLRLQAGTEERVLKFVRE